MAPAAGTGPHPQPRRRGPPLDDHFADNHHPDLPTLLVSHLREGVLLLLSPYRAHLTTARIDKWVIPSQCPRYSRGCPPRTAPGSVRRRTGSSAGTPAAPYTAAAP